MTRYARDGLGRVYAYEDGLGQRGAASCLNPIWPFVGGAIIWHFLGDPIKGLIGLGAKGAEKGTRALALKVGAPVHPAALPSTRARLPRPSGSA